jgi:3-deoxy-D-manno-octulosonic-acid transferase
MNILYGIYVLLTSVLFLTLFPLFLLYTGISGRYKKGLGERLGYINSRILKSPTGAPLIWIHAVSLGEIRVAESIIKSLRITIPGCSVIVSTTTDHSRELASRIFGDRIPIIYAPIDFILSVRKALYSIHPDIIIFLETEIWPLWITEAKRMGVKTALVNGRISSRSFKRYLRFRYFFRYVLKNMELFSMITEKDMFRINAIGADSSRIIVGGNAKYDLLPELAEPHIVEEIRNIFNIDSSSTIFIAGSTRTGEETIIIDAYKKINKEFPEIILFLAPRHIKRAKEIASLLDNSELKFQYRSEIDGETVKRTEKVVIINSFGELFRLYSIGTIAFCGASLVPLGGQNPLEPAVWGNAVLYGPYMDNFLDAKGLLDEKKAGIQVSDSETLAEKVISLLRDPESLNRQGLRAREAVMSNKNAGERHAGSIAGLLKHLC